MLTAAEHCPICLRDYADEHAPCECSAEEPKVSAWEDLFRSVWHRYVSQPVWWRPTA